MQSLFLARGGRQRVPDWSLEGSGLSSDAEVNFTGQPKPSLIVCSLCCPQTATLYAHFFCCQASRAKRGWNHWFHLPHILLDAKKKSRLKPNAVITQKNRMQWKSNEARTFEHSHHSSFWMHSGIRTKMIQSVKMSDIRHSVLQIWA